jgi:adenylate cyclase
VRAAIMICDLRDFTHISDNWPRDDVIDLLNGYFDAMSEPIARHGGEILKFMGDGMLAMFTVPSPAERADVALRAARAAASVSDAMTVLNRLRAAADEPIVRFGLALHIGEVMFGNIGASNRLDFTVIGPAVNHAARLEKLCSEIDRSIVLSSAFARLLPDDDAVLLGQRSLKDVDRPQAIYGLRG